KGLDIFYQTFHIPDDVHPQLPSPNQTIHEMPSGKIGVYTRFFEYANFRLPLSTFLVNVLRYYRINLSQLSVIAAAKVSHFEILCRVHGIEPTVRLFRCFYVDSFACPASFPWHTDKNVSRDPFPKSTEFSADDYVVLVTHPAPFQKFLEPFLCLIGMSQNYTLDEDTYPTFLHDDGTEMDLFAFIRVADPTKVKVGEREHAKEEARLLDSTVGHVVPLLSVTPARAESELEASIERLFDEGGDADQGDFAAGGGHGAKTESTTGVRIIVAENMTAERLTCPRKKRQAATDASGSSHPPKKLRGGYKTSGEAATSGKSPSVLKELLASNMLNVEAGVAAVATLHMVTSSVSMTPPPVMTEAVITTNVAIIPSAPAPETSTRVVTPVHASMFHDSDSTGMVKPTAAGSSHVPGKELSLGSQEVDSENLHEIRDMDYEELFTEFNIGTTCQACLSAEVRMQIEYCLSERKGLESKCGRQETEAAEVARLRAHVSAFEAAERVHVDELNILRQKNLALEDERNSLNGKVTKLQSLVFAKGRELEDVDVIVTSLKFHNDGLVNQVHALEATCFGLHEQLSGYENLTERLEEFQDAQLKVINDKVAKLDADLAEMACHLEEKFYHHLLTTIFGRRWLLTYGMKLILIKCLNLLEYLTTLGAAISRAIEKGMQDGLAAGIDHGREGRSLTGVSHKDASVEGIMNLLRLEGPLADDPGMGDLQPDIESGQTLQRNASTSVSVPAATVTTTALSTTFAFASSIPPITVDDYEIVHADGQESS
ncbi:hypothetical protein Tco_1307654, partial [Tanacetum coccineum]